MKRIGLSLLGGLLVAIFVGGAALASAAGKKPLPLKGSIEGQETYQPNGSTMSVTGTASGELTHLGRYTVSYAVQVDLPTGTGSGLTAQFVAANGDSLSAEGSGQATPTDDPNVFRVVESFTITGGTGRFENASGSVTFDRVVNLATGATSGSVDGTIQIP